MANRDIGGKIRSKRSHKSSKPYDRRKSLLTRFTDTIRDILLPSWLSDFVNNQAENSQNAVIEEEDQNGNEIKDNEDNYSSSLEGSVIGDRRPAQPRPLHPEYTNYHQQVKAVSRRSAMAGYTADHMAANHEMQYPPGPRYSASNHAGSLPHAGQMSETNTRVNDKQNCLTGADIEHLNNRLHPSADTQHTSDMNYQSTTASVDNDDDGNGSVSVDPEDSCDYESSKIWSNISYLKKNESDSFRTKPRFEPSLLASPTMKDSLLSDSRSESVFYGGKTQYGGASARKRMRLNESNPYSAAMPYRRQVNAKPLHRNSTGAVTSSTAKKISDILEMMATPISDARKIPMNNHNLADTVLQFTPSSFKRRTRPSAAVSTFSCDSERLPPRGPPTVMMNSPSIATIAKNRQLTSSAFRSSPTIQNHQKDAEPTNSKVSSFTGKDASEQLPVVVVTPPSNISVQKTKAATITAATTTTPPAAATTSSSKTNYFVEKPLLTESSVAVPDSSPSLDRPMSSGKMKREKSYSTRGTLIRDEDEEVEPVHLKTDFVLPVKDMPKFSFTTPENTFSKQSEKLTSTPVTTSVTTFGSGSSQSTVISTTASSAVSITNFTTSESGFKFSSPIPTTLPTTNLVQEGSPSLSDFEFSSPEKVVVDSPNNLFQFTPSSTLPKPKSTASVFAKPACTLKTSGGVMDILSGSKPVDSSSSTATNSGGIQAASTLKTGSVMDILGGQKKETSESQVDPLMAKFLNSDTWDCDTCMLQNKAEDKKCIACETPRPGAASSKATTSTANIVTDSLMARLISSPDSWECETCMLQNKPQATKCIACAAPKPSTASQPKVGVPSKPDSLMAKFLQPSDSWDCDTCMLQNKAEATKCIACESPRPGYKPTLSSTVAPTLPEKVDPLMAKFLKPADSWECSVCMLENKGTDRACVACQTANPNAPAATPSSNAASHCLSQTEPQSVGTSNCQLDKALSMWKCDTCLVSNPLHFRKCIACDTPHIKPAVMATIAANSSGSVDVLPKYGVITSTGFKFDTSSIFDSSKGSSGFKFIVSTSSSTPISSSFKLSTASSNDSTPASSGFKLGTSSNTDTTPASSGFKFGTSSNTDTTPASSGFKFGTSSNTDTTPASSGFKFGTSSNTDTTPASSGFKFGTSSNTDTTPASSGFKFGTSSNTDSTSTSSGFKFGGPSSQADSAKSESGNGSSSFKFGYVAPSGDEQTDSGFKFGNSGETKEKSDDQTKFGGFVFSQTKSDGFSFSNKEITPVSSVADPSPSNSGSTSSPSCTTAVAAPVTTTVSTFATTAAASTTTGFSFVGTDRPIATAFKIPASDIKTTFPVSTEKSATSIFGTTASSDSTKNIGSTFTFGAVSDNSNNTNPPTSGQPKLPFTATSPLKRERDEDADGPSGAKRSGSSAAINTTPADFNFSAAVQPNAVFSGGFTAFSDSTNKNPFSTTTTNSSTASNNQQFQFGSPIPTFGAISSSSSSSTTASSTFTSPGFGFVPAPTTAPAPTTTTTQSTPTFVFGSPASAAASPATFGATPATFPFNPTTPAAPLFNSKPFSVATTTPATTNFTSNRGSEPFSFSTTGGFQFQGKQSSDNTTTATAATTAANSNLFQFGQTPPINTNTSFQFSSTPNFNFTSGNTSAGFSFSGNSDSSLPQAGRVMKKAIRRNRKL